MQHFLQAISLSAKYGFPHEEAISNERAWMFLQRKSTGTSPPDSKFLLQSYQCYEKWGCQQKMLHLKGNYPQLSKLMEESPNVSFVGLELGSTMASAVSALADDGSELSDASSVNSYSTSSISNPQQKKRRYD